MDNSEENFRKRQELVQAIIDRLVPGNSNPERFQSELEKLIARFPDNTRHVDNTVANLIVGTRVKKEGQSV